MEIRWRKTGDMRLNPRDPITLSDDEQGVYNHLRNARYLASITILSFGDWIPRETITGWWFQICFIFTPIWGNDPILSI